MKRNAIIGLTAFALTAVLAGPSQALAQQAGKIAVVNSAQAFQDSAQGKRIIAQLQARDAKIRAEMKRMDDAILAMESKINTGRLTMTQDALLALQTDYNKKTTDRKCYEEDAAREFQQYRDGLVQPIQKEMVDVIKAIRKEKGYDVIFDLTVGGIVDFEPAVDVTPELIRRYDAMKAPAAPVKK